MSANTRAEKAAYAAVAQPHCALPWCGESGVKIDLHHIKPRSQGGETTVENLIPICHSCHMKHHSNEHLRFSNSAWIDGKREVYAWDGDGHEGWCVFYDPCRDTPSPEEMDADDGEFLSECEQAIVALSSNSNATSYRISHTLKAALEAFEKKYPPKEARRRLTEWAAELEDEAGNKRPIAPSTLSKMLAGAELPDIVSIHDLSVAERYRLKRALDKRIKSFEDTMDDLYHLSIEDFENVYFGKVAAIEKPRCECPVCHGVHKKKRPA